MRGVSERREPSVRSLDEISSLRGWLDFHRETARRKTGGLDSAALARTLPPSTMTLGGLLKHLAFVEHWWTRCILAGEDFGAPWDAVDWEADGDWDWHSAVDDTPEQIRALYDAEVAAADALIDAALASPTGLDTDSVRPDRHSGEPFTLRWILMHLIEEYARHNGHADLMREAVDGSTGQ